jgi:hypothetical protein
MLGFHVCLSLSRGGVGCHITSTVTPSPANEDMDPLRTSPCCRVVECFQNCYLVLASVAIVSRVGGMLREKEL